jgi:peptide deformylase
MAIMKIRLYGDDVLRKKNKYIKKFDKKLVELVNSMFDTCMRQKASVLLHLRWDC